MLHYTIISTICTVLTVSSTSAAQYYKALRDEQKLQNLALHSAQFTLVDSPLLALFRKLDDEIDPRTLKELQDDASLIDFVKELLTPRVLDEQHTPVRVMKGVFAITDALVEKKNIQRKEIIFFSRVNEKILVELRKIISEIKELTEQIESMQQVLEKQKKLLGWYTEETEKIRSMLSIPQTSDIPAALRDADAHRLETSQVLHTTTQNLLSTMKETITLFTEKRAQKIEAKSQLIIERDVRTALIGKAHQSCALWNEALIKLGLIYKGAVSKSLMVDLIEEYWAAAKQFGVNPSFLSSQESETAFSQLRSDLNLKFIPSRTDHGCVIC